MNYELTVLGAIFVPICSAFILPLFARVSRVLRNFLALAVVVLSCVLSLRLIPLVLSGQTVVINYPLVLGFEFHFCADALAVFMASVSSFLSAVILIYSFDYVSHYDNQNEYYLMVVLFLGSMMGLVFSANLILLYVFWEITAITSWRLIGFFREPAFVQRADKAFLITMFGAVLMLLGFIMVYQQTGSFRMSPVNISGLATGLILCGILSKSATLPFQTWLPDAGVAPSPVTALLHAAILVKIGVYVFARLFLASFFLPESWRTIVLFVAALSALIAAGAAFIETDIKRIVAYSTISQIGFIFFGLAVGNPLATSGALLYILMHGLAKAGLFLCAGIIEQNTKTKDITKLGGLMRTMPFTAIAFLFCSFSIMGIPPFGGFFSKYMVFAGAAQTKHLGVTFLFLIAAFGTILYLFRVFNLVFMGETKAAAPKEGGPLMVGVVVVLALLSLLSGVFINYFSGFTNFVVETLPGVIR